MTISQIIKGTKAGRTYGHLVAGHERFPVILDGGGNTVSLPPDYKLGNDCGYGRHD